MLNDFPSASHDAWKARTPEDRFEIGRRSRLRQVSRLYEDSSDICGGCGYFIDECACEEDYENE